MAKKSNGWVMAEEDVSGGFHGTGSMRSGKLTRTSRSVSPTGPQTVYLVHNPTGLRVEAILPRGNYSHADLSKERLRIERALWSELEIKVARHLRIPGR